MSRYSQQANRILLQLARRFPQLSAIFIKLLARAPETASMDIHLESVVNFKSQSTLERHVNRHIPQTEVQTLYYDMVKSCRYFLTIDYAFHTSGWMAPLSSAFFYRCNNVFPGITSTALRQELNQRKAQLTSFSTGRSLNIQSIFAMYFPVMQDLSRIIGNYSAQLQTNHPEWAAAIAEKQALLQSAIQTYQSHCTTYDYDSAKVSFAAHAVFAALGSCRDLIASRTFVNREDAGLQYAKSTLTAYASGVKLFHEEHTLLHGNLAQRNLCAGVKLGAPVYAGPILHELPTLACR